MDLTIRTESFDSDDRSWLASDHATDTAFPVTLNASLFTSGTHYPNGYLKSGIVLGKVTASGLYGPYDDAAVDGRQTAAGILLAAVDLPNNSADVSAARPQGAALDHCIVVASKLVGIDANGRTDLKGVLFR